MAKQKQSFFGKSPRKTSSTDDLRLECETLAATIDAVEGYPSPHATRIAGIAERLGRALGLADETCLELRLAALVHDIGEQALHLTFLRQDRRIDFTERLELMRHPIVGEQQAAQRGLSVAVGLLVRWHHENWDGSGYPDGLSGRQIPLSARILRAADVYCTLTVLRPFRDAHTAREAVRILKRMAGIELDPRVVRVLLQIEAEKAAEEEEASLEAARRAAEPAAPPIQEPIPEDMLRTQELISEPWEGVPADSDSEGDGSEPAPADEPIPLESLLEPELNLDDDVSFIGSPPEQSREWMPVVRDENNGGLES